MGIYSQAFNKGTEETFGVSPQTGLYSFSETLLTLGNQIDSEQGVTREFFLKYSALTAQSNQNTPFGAGWSIGGISRYELSADIQLSNDQKFSSDGIKDGELTFRDQKTQDFYVMDQANGSYVVYNKDGIVEILIPRGNTTFTLHQLVFPNGEIYTFFYHSLEQEQVLWKITDSEGTVLMELEYGTNYLIAIKVRHDNGEYAYFYTSVSNQGTYSLLERLSRPVKEGAIVNDWIEFNYEDAQDFQVINQVQYPEGAAERIYYDSEGNLYKPSSTVLSTPRVRQYIHDPGANQPAIEEFYTYPDNGHNYLGYPNKNGWENTQDNLYKWGNADSYEYWVQVTKAKETENETIQTHYYNTFHLKTRERIEKGGCITETISLYVSDEPENRNKTFSDQPDNLLFPIKTTKIFQKGKVNQSYSVEMETDVYGNPLKKVEFSGLTQTSDYYPIEGEEGNCPPAPFGHFRCFVKEQKVISADQDQIQQKQFFYGKLRPLNSGLDYIKYVVKATKIEYGDGITVGLRANLNYAQVPDSLFINNNIRQVIISLYQADGQALQTKVNIIYEYKDGWLMKDREVVGYDGTRFGTSETESVYTGLVVRQVNRDGLVSEAIYDIQDRVVINKSAVGTNYEQVVTYKYETFNEADKGPTTVRINDTGYKDRLGYDGSGRMVKAEKQDENHIYRLVLTQNFDNLGQAVEQTEADYYPDGRVFSNVKTEMAYDGWGLLYESKTNDGVVQLISNDPFHLKQRKQLVIRDDAGKITIGLAPETTSYNLFQSPERIEQESRTAGKILTQMYYDGFGRKRRTIYPLGQETSIEVYDVFNRICRTKGPDDQMFEMTYAAFSPQKLIAGVFTGENENKALLGEKTYDGIARVTHKTVAGVKTQYQYQDSGTLPHRIITQAGNTMILEYNPAIDNLPISIGAWRGKAGSPEEAEVWNTFQYATQSEPTPCGKLTSARGNNGMYSFSYSPEGQITESTQEVAQGPTGKTCFREQTLLGQIIVTTLDIGGKETNRNNTYDTFGRLLSTTQGDITSTFDYDAFGRVIAQKIKEKDTVRQWTEIAWDDLSREVSRKITAYLKEAKSVYQLDFTYDSENKLTERIKTLDGTEKLKEKFDYNAYNQLINYQIAKGYDPDFLPQNEQGSKFTRQTFTFDRFSNITTVTTEFDNGERDTAVWHYARSENRRPDRITYSLTDSLPVEVLFEYDPDGNLTRIKSSKGERQLSYSVAGRVLRYCDQEEGVDENFTYDVFQRVLTNNAVIRYYLGNSLAKQLDKDGTFVEFVRSGGQVFAEHSGDDTQIIGTDQFFSAILVHNTAQLTPQNYGAYGATRHLVSQTGFTGLIKPTHAPFYMLGNGTRLYTPQYGLFSSMDSAAVFGEGGLNPYQYCEGDPTNKIDPSGHQPGKSVIAAAGSGTAAAIILVVIVLAYAVYMIFHGGGLGGNQVHPGGGNGGRGPGGGNGGRGPGGGNGGRGPGGGNGGRGPGGGNGGRGPGGGNGGQEPNQGLGGNINFHPDPEQGNQARLSQNMLSTLLSTDKRIQPKDGWIDTTTGSDFDAFVAAINNPNPIVARSLNILSSIIGNTTGTIQDLWHVDNNGYTSMGGLNSYVAHMVPDKYPMP